MERIRWKSKFCRTFFDIYCRLEVYTVTLYIRPLPTWLVTWVTWLATIDLIIIFFFTSFLLLDLMRQHPFCFKKHVCPLLSSRIKLILNCKQLFPNILGSLSIINFYILHCFRYKFWWHFSRKTWIYYGAFLKPSSVWPIYSYNNKNS